MQHSETRDVILQYGPVIFHMLFASEHCMVVNAFKTLLPWAVHGN